MAIVISGNGIDMGGNPVSNASQVEVQENQVSPFSGFKNYIINGNFDIWQRGTSQTTSGYGADRWVTGSVGSTFSVNRIKTDFSPSSIGLLTGASYVYQNTVTSIAGTNNQTFLMQLIENVEILSGKTVTLSFYARTTDSNKKIGFILHQSFGTGGSPSANVGSNQQYFEITTSWKKYTTTITIPSIQGKTIGTDGVHTTSTGIRFQFDAGTSAASALGVPELTQQSGVFQISNVQLEEGSVATPFEQRHIGLELSLCQRYYEKIDSQRCNIPVYGTGTGFLGSVKYKVPKRTVPTVSLGTTSHWRTIVIYNGAALSALNIQETTAYSFDVNGTSSGGNIPAGYAGKIQVNDAYTDNGTDGIFVSAEL